jgi:hypothetical protein
MKKLIEGLKVMHKGMTDEFFIFGNVGFYMLMIGGIGSIVTILGTIIYLITL